MRLGVVGIREFNGYDFLCQAIDDLGIDVTCIVTGGARGVDSLAMRYAREHNLGLVVHWPRWELYGRPAGPIRNRLIVRDSNAVLALWDGSDRGTLSSISLAREAGKSLKIIMLNEKHHEISDREYK